MRTPGPQLSARRLAGALVLGLAPLGAAQDAEVRRGVAPVDAFHPDGATPAAPAYGGTLTVHMISFPQGLCYPIDPVSYSRRLLRELHETLVERDWETWEFRPRLAKGWETEDTLILKGGRSSGNTNVLYGRVFDGGEHWIVQPVSLGNPLTESRQVPKADVLSVERQTVYTFELREGVKWHDGHPLDTRDVLFSWSIYANPHVDCDSVRAKYQKIVHCESVGERHVRFFYERQYFNVLDTLEDFIILPAHVYDLSDPANPDHDPQATPEKQGKFINENPHNTQWIGLGPYALKSWGPQVIEAERFERYFDPEQAGYVDALRWRQITSDDTTFQALINGEVDYMERLSSADYFGAATQAPEFTEKLYKGYIYVPAYNYTPWNLRRPQFADLQVRLALAHCFDFEEYRKTVAHGLAKIVTGPQFYFGDAYDHDVQPFPYDLGKAEEMLAEAGWYDRDGDGIIDNGDGLEFEFEFLMQSGNKASQLFSQVLQENLAKVGIKMNITSLDWNSFINRIRDKDFDAAGLAWSFGPETDPEQVWHSRGAAEGVRGSNHASVADPHVDELIEKGQRELDPAKRIAIWREFHRYLYYEVQPYLFREMPPRKFALSKRVRGVQIFALDPGYSLRRWYFPAGTPGTRPKLER